LSECENGATYFFVGHTCSLFQFCPDVCSEPFRRVGVAQSTQRDDEHVGDAVEPAVRGHLQTMLQIEYWPRIEDEMMEES
jgi:hypothetical protein